MRGAVGIAMIMLACSVSVPAVCRQPQPRLVCAEYFQEQAVVIAKLVRIEDVGDKEAIVGHFYTLSLEKTFRGTIDRTFRIWEELTSGRAGFDWVQDKSYLLFLSFSRNDHTAWVLDGCGNSGPFTQAEKALREIEAIKAEHGGGFVSGNISSESPPESLNRVSIVVTGRGHTYEGSTDQEGNFRVRVPAGIYKLNASRPDWFFRKDDFSYDDPQRISIENGGCAQVQLVGQPARH